VVTVPGYTPPVTRATFRRSAVAAVAVALIGLVVLIPLGHGAYALFGCVGLALGVLNSYLTVRSVVRFAATRPSRAQFSGSVLGRLAVVTVLAFACALLFRPAGIAVFGGLVVFQFLAIASSLLPLIKEIRQR
jgi:dolichyl-phosphate-mannose--protein O-mannosyl transferase